jgi:hypothetical protein
MKLVQLQDIAVVRAAIIFRDKAPVQAAMGNVHALTIKDIVADWPIVPNVLPRIEVANNMLSNCLAGGEVLIPGRGDNYPARYFQEQTDLIFPYGQINIIVPGAEVLGRYLAWYINQAKTQGVISQSLTGSSIKALVRSRLLELEIELPSRETQKAIADLQQLREESKVVKERLILLEGQEVEWTCQKLFEKNSDSGHG